MALKYRPDIDGLRAVAVLSVVLFHLGAPYFSGGFVGVDVFFVISGFLITRLINNECQSGTFSLKRFYLRRLRRLGPALLFTLAVCLLGSFFLLSVKNFESFSGSLASAVLSVSNFWFWMDSGYFAASTATKPLLHTWSLSIEEQFYLAWPVTLLFLIRSRVSPLIFLIAAGLISLVLAKLFEENTASFYLIPFRVYEFAIGASLVWLQHLAPNDRKISSGMTIAGLALIGWSVLIFNTGTPFPSLAALAPCIGTALIIQAGNTDSLVLSNRATVGVGLISYSLYLVHWPIIVFYGAMVQPPMRIREQAAVLVVSMAAAYLMYRFVETPFRRPSTSTKKLVASCASMATVTLVLGLAAHHNAGWPTRIDRAYDNSPLFAANLASRVDSIIPGAAGDVVLYGDSHAIQYIPALTGLTKSLGYNLRLVVRTSCMALPGIVSVHTENNMKACRLELDRLREQHPKLIIVAFAWPKRLIVDGKELFYAYSDEAKYTEVVLSRLDKLLSEFLDTKKLIIGNVPSSNLVLGYTSCSDRLIRPSWCHQKYPREDGDFFKATPIFEKHARGNVSFLNPYDALCDDRDCFVVRDRTLYYSDVSHLTAEGAKAVVNLAAPSIAAALNQNTIQSLDESGRLK